MVALEDTPNGCRLTIRVTPRSSRSMVDGYQGDALKIRLNAPPVEGKANDALVQFLSEKLELPRRSIVLESGDRSRNKRVLVIGTSARAITQRLGLD